MLLAEVEDAEDDGVGLCDSRGLPVERAVELPIAVAETLSEVEKRMLPVLARGFIHTHGAWFAKLLRLAAPATPPYFRE